MSAAHPTTSEPHTSHLEPIAARGSLHALLVACRPKQWTKNLLLFAALLFTLDTHHSVTNIVRAGLGFLIFCLVSSAGYLFNDVLDIDTDRHHPRKRHRPIAAGQISPAAALTYAAVITAFSIFFAFELNMRFGIATVAYVVLTSAYTARFKHVVILDLLLLAMGFVLRAVAGAWVIPVRISEWLFLCTLLLALFLGISKRRAELVAVNSGRRVGRPILSEYSAEMLDQMSTIVTSALLMSYALYTIQSPAGIKYHQRLLVTIPFVIYGIFRYLYLIHRRSLGESPDEILIKDRPMLLNIVLWALTTAVIVLHP